MWHICHSSVSWQSATIQAVFHASLFSPFLSNQSHKYAQHHYITSIPKGEIKAILYISVNFITNVYTYFPYMNVHVWFSKNYLNQKLLLYITYEISRFEISFT